MLLIAAGLAAWLALAAWSWRVYANPRAKGDIISGIVWDFLRLYSRIFHGMTVRGKQHIPPHARIDGRPVIVVSNHSAGVDPILIQSSLPWFVRWLMAADMQGSGLTPLWQFVDVILIDRTGKPDMAAIRAAIHTLATNHATIDDPRDQGSDHAQIRHPQSVGIFPEGRLRRTPTELNPFLPGVGLLVCRSKAIVLPVVIRGTPFASQSWGSLIHPSRSTLEYHAPIDYAALGTKPGDIAADLESRYRAWMSQPL